MARITTERLDDCRHPASVQKASVQKASAARLNENESQYTLWTAGRFSTFASIVLHGGMLFILATVVMATNPCGVTPQLNATFAADEVDDGGAEFGNSSLEIELPDHNANLLQSMDTVVSTPVTAIPESPVALQSIPGFTPADALTSGGANAGSGAMEGKSGSGSGAGESDDIGRGRVTFFGKEVAANSVAFVIDASKSMSGIRFQRARAELVNALRKLQPEQRFFVVFYTNETYPMFFPDNTIELIEASQRNLDRVFHWIEQSQVQGGTQPQLAMVLTLKLKPDVVFFLSDGDIPLETQGIVKFNNHGTTVHTITFGSDVGAAIMRRIAAKNGGDYRFIPDGF